MVHVHMQPAPKRCFYLISLLPRSLVFCLLLSLPSLLPLLCSPFPPPSVPPLLANPTHRPPPASQVPAARPAGTLAPASAPATPAVDRLPAPPAPSGRSREIRGRRRPGREETRSHVGAWQRQAAGCSEDPAVAAPAAVLRLAVAAALRRARRVPPLPHAGCGHGPRRHLRRRRRGG